MAFAVEVADAIARESTSRLAIWARVNPIPAIAARLIAAYAANSLHPPGARFIATIVDGVTFLLDLVEEPPPSTIDPSIAAS
jgi:hypothetical protein